ncbi:ABC transporter ATP-binding protein [Alteribacter aurantiacus]|uniref:ABC transporter ATP-binding protein n=1 Tax=Alteribacter aurantiacus TaxID=254410 RepID=UPI0004066317|nr:ABC transporter ATP-binding protein [Alteribacter aurantiacus]
MNEHVVKIEGLTYFHSKQAKGLDSVSLTLEKGKVYGLWGRNGAGKTTLMKVLAGFFRPDEGSVKLFSEAPFENRNVLKKMCFIQENHPLNPAWKIKDVLRVASYFYPKWDEELAAHSLRAFSLDGKKRVKTLSKGMKTAVALTVGLASRAEFTVFDEPTNGLDAAVREVFYDLLVTELEEGDRTFLLSTHFIQELQSFIEEMIVMDQGKLALQKSMETIREGAVYVTGSKEALGVYLTHRDVLETKSLGNTVSLLVEKESELWQELQDVESMNEVPSLQEYLLRKTDRKKEGVGA